MSTQGDAYLVPFGIDPATFLKGIGDMEDGTDQLVKKSAEANATMQKSFDASGQAANQASQIFANYGKQIDAVAGQTQSYFVLAQRLSELQSALFTEKSVAAIKVYQQEIDIVKQKITDLSNVGKAGFDDLGKKIVEQKGLLEALQDTATRYKTAIQKATDPSTIATYNKLLTVTNQKITDLTNAGKIGFDNLGKKLTDDIGLLAKLNAQADNFRKSIQNATSIEQIAVLNKGLQETNIQIGQVSNVGKTGFDELGNALVDTTKKGNLLGQGFSFIRQAAYLIPGIGIAGIFNLIGEAVVDLAKHLFNAGDGFDQMKDKAALLTEVQKTANASVADEITDLQVLYKVATDTTQSTKDRTDAVKALQREFPDTFANLKTEAILNGDSKKSYDDLTQSILATSRAKAATNKLDEIAAQLLDIEFQKQKINNAANQELNAPKTDIFQSTQFTQGAKQVSISVADQNATINAARDRALQEQNINQQRLENQQKFLVQFAGGEVAVAQVIEAKSKEEADAGQKLLDDELKAYQDLLAKLTSQEQELNAKAIEDTREAALKASDAKFQKIIDDGQREVDEAKVTNAQRASLQEEFEKVYTAAIEANATDRLAINKKFNDAQQKVEQEAGVALASIQTSKQQEEIAKVEEHYAKLAETIHKGGLLDEQAQAEIALAQANDIDAINIKFGTEQIKKTTDLNVASINVSQQYALKHVAVEKAKQLAILQAQLDGAQAQLKLLTDNGKTENDIEVKNAELAVKNLQDAIKKTKGNNGKGQTLFEFLGISTDSQVEITQFAKAASEAGKITSDLFSALSAGLQNQIDLKKQAVDADNEAISSLQDQLQKEKDLQDQGLANNVDNIQKELDAKTAARDADLKSQQDLQAKQNALKKAQIIADSVAQVSNLITAASEIFATFSVIPFVGVPLAIAAIAVMFGAFAAAKINAIKAVSATTTMGEGGVVDGKPHSEGGKKYRAVDGSGAVVELEGGEYVTNKKSTRKYENLLDAINHDDLGGMTEEGMRAMFADMGISMGMEPPKEALKIVKMKNDLTQQVIINNQPATDISGDVKAIHTHVEYLAGQEKKRPTTWEDATHFYVKIGNKTTKTPKK